MGATEEDLHRYIAPLLGPDDERVVTDPGIEIKPLYDEDDVAPGLEERLGEPGSYPFTRGIHGSDTRMWNGFLRGRTRLALLLATALLSINVTVATASAATVVFSNSTVITIPDAGPASLYPSSINVSGFAGNVQKATATLHSFSHTCPDDLAVLLVGPSGANSILFAAYTDGAICDDAFNVTLTFDETATRFVSSPLVSGTFKPTQGGPIPSLDPPAPGEPYAVDFNVFNGKPANGTWSLFIEDQVSGESGLVLAGWSLRLAAPLNYLTASRPKLNKKKGTAEIPVAFADSGQLTLSGKGVKTASKGVVVPGTGEVNLTVKAKGKTARKLNTTGKAKVQVNITFTPTGGVPRSTPVTVKLKMKL